jgi:hypothetical protein
MRALQPLIHMMQRQTGYQLRGSGKAWANILQDPYAQALITMRRGETHLQVVAAGLAAAGTLSATVRVPPAVNRARGTIRQLANHARSDKAKSVAKLVKTFGEVQKRLADAVGPRLIEVIGRAATGVKLVADVPLEWLPVGNLPLALCKDVARITTTPGNLQIGLLARSGLLHLAVEAFFDVLVVTAFDPKDPIANVLPRQLASWQEMYEGRLTVRLVQAQSRSEFVNALNRFAGAVMIFDGHGHHDRATGQGTLRVGKEDISIWEMRGEVRVPPIVILSACDTHAADRSHATTANGFLHAGAITVVASLLPVEAHDAALLIARLIWRLAEFLPAITSEQGRAVLWSEVMSGMLRLQLVYDLVMPLLMEGRISASDYEEINMRAIMATANRSPNWWDDALKRLGELIGEDGEALDKRAARVIATSDVIRYTQLGNPEKIVIKSRALLRAMGYDV